MREGWLKGFIYWKSFFLSFCFVLLKKQPKRKKWWFKAINNICSLLCWAPSPHILMLHVFEQPELPVSPLSEDLRLEGPVELLDGHFLFILLVDCRAVGGGWNTRQHIITSVLSLHEFHYDSAPTEVRTVGGNERMSSAEVFALKEISILVKANEGWSAVLEARRCQLLMCALALICRAALCGRRGLSDYFGAASTNTHHTNHFWVVLFAASTRRCRTLQSPMRAAANVCHYTSAGSTAH